MTESRASRALRSFGMAATVATLAAGAVMMVGGYLFPVDGWAVAGWVMTPSGPLISVAFALAQRARGRSRAPSRVGRARHFLTLIVGMPSAGGDLGPLASIATSGLAVLAGAIMAVAGYAIARWSPDVVPPIVLAGGAVIAAAFVIADRGGRPAAGGLTG